MIKQSLLLLSMPGPYELIVIFLVVLLVFGGSRIPEIGKFLGQGIREFKKALRGMSIDDGPDTNRQDSEDQDSD